MGIDFFSRFQDIDFALLVFSSALILFLGLLVYFNNRNSITNRTFVLFTIIGTLYATANYFFYNASVELIALWLSRIVIFFATWYSFFLFQLFYVFPKEKFEFSRKYKLVLIPLVVLVSILNLTSVVFPRIATLATQPGEVSVPGIGWGAVLFAGISLYLMAGGVIILFKKLRKSYGVERVQLGLIFTGTVITYSLYSIFNMGFTIVFNDTSFIPYAAVFALPFIVLTFYAIVKHRLFNIKVIATEALVVVIWILLFAKIFIAQSTSGLVVDIIIFVITIPFGILLIRSVIKEVRLAEQQYEMVATVSHQLRTPLTPVLGYAAMMEQGDFDDHPKELKEAEHSLLMATQRLRNIINDFLQIFELEGEHKIDVEKTTLKKMIDEAIVGIKQNYDQKGLYLKLDNPDNVDAVVTGETKLLIQAVNNLLDNAQRYTQQGGTTVHLALEKSRAIIKVADTGIGLDDKDKDRLFSKFYRSDAAKEVRPDGSGLGLPIVKTIVEAHGGHVYAESEGRGKGTTFIIELPVKASKL